MIRVTDFPYGAKGDGITNDRAAIQAAIDHASEIGGDTIVFTAGMIFLTANLFLKSHVKLHFEDGAMLKQDPNADDYVKPMPDGTYAPTEIVFGHNVMDVAWGHSFYFNYPFIYAGEGTENIAITGKGTIELTRGTSCDDTIHVITIGFYRVTNFELSDFTIQKFNAYVIDIINSAHGLCKNLTLQEPTDGNGDGISLIGSHDIRITGCNLTTSDDGIYTCVTYGDPRAGLWYTCDQPTPVYNIEIDHNNGRVIWEATKALCFIMWGNGCADPCTAEVSHIYVHDNHFQTMGAWTGNWVNGQFEFNGKTNAIKDVRFENNIIDIIQDNFYDLHICDFYGYDSMTALQNVDFSLSNLYWISQGKTGVAEQGSRHYGYIDGADARLYQGIKLTGDVTYEFRATVQASGVPGRLFVRDQISNTPIALQEFNNTTWESVSFFFTVPTTGNYRLGLEGIDDEGRACFTDVSCIAI